MGGFSRSALGQALLCPRPCVFADHPQAAVGAYPLDERANARSILADDVSAVHHVGHRLTGIRLAPQPLAIHRELRVRRIDHALQDMSSRVPRVGARRSKRIFSDGGLPVRSPDG